MAFAPDWGRNGLGEMQRAISVISIAENGEPKHDVCQLLLAECACLELVIFVPVHTLQAKQGKMRTVFAQRALSHGNLLCIEHSDESVQLRLIQYNNTAPAGSAYRHDSQADSHRSTPETSYLFPFCRYSGTVCKA